MNDFAMEMRRAAQALLPKGAFLRRDRGDALYVTDAPRRGAEIDWGAAGFLCREEGGLACLTPGPAWLERLAARYPEPPDFLCASLRRVDGDPDEATLRLFARIMKALDGGPVDPNCEKALRQRAAVCLREKRGGGLYACGVALRVVNRH